MFTVLKLLSGLVFWKRRASCVGTNPRQCDDALSLGTCASITVIRSLTDVEKHFGDRASPEQPFVVGGRVQRKDGSGRGTVTERCDLWNRYGKQYLVVKWDGGESTHIDETGLVHESFVVGDRVRCWPGSAHVGTVTEQCSRDRYRTQHLVVKWDSGASDIHRAANLVYVGGDWSESLVHIHVCAAGECNDNCKCDNKILQFDIGDRVRRRVRTGAGVGTVTQCWPRHLIIKWDGGLGNEMWGRAGLVHSQQTSTGKLSAHDNDCPCSECYADMRRQREERLYCRYRCQCRLPSGYYTR